MTSYPPPPTPSRDVTPVGDLGLDATDAMMAVDPVTGTMAKAGKWVWEHKWDIGNRIISYGPTLRNIWGRMSGASKEEFNRWYRKRHYDNPELFEQALNDTLLDISSGTMLGSGGSTNFDEKALMKMVNERYKEYCKGPTKGSIPYAESHAHNADPKWRAKMQQTYDPTIMDAPAKIAKRLKPGSDKKFVKIDTKRRKHDGNSYRAETGDLELIKKNRKQIENREDVEAITRYMDHMPTSFTHKETAKVNNPIHDVTMEKIKKERGAEAAFKLEHGDVDPKAVYPERQEKKFETKEERDKEKDVSRGADRQKR